MSEQVSIFTASPVFSSIFKKIKIKKQTFPVQNTNWTQMQIWTMGGQPGSALFRCLVSDFFYSRQAKLFHVDEF